MITDVVIVGAGPTGLMLACELILAGARPVVLERLAERDQEAKANGLVGQVVRMIDHRGLYEPFGGKPGLPEPNAAYFMVGGLGLDLSALGRTSPLYTLPVPQRHIVAALEERAIELGVDIRRSHEVTGVEQDEDAVTIEFTGPRGPDTLRARYLVGAEGSHSPTRKLSGIAFDGVSYDRRIGRTAHATVPPEWVEPDTGVLNVPGFGAIRPFLPVRTDSGGFAYAPLPEHPPLIRTEEWDQSEPEEPMSLAEMRASARRVLGVDLPLGEPDRAAPRQLSRRSGDSTRMAERLRDRRIFLVGDAAHVFSGGGGPGLNVGMQDAANLGWKLAAAVCGTAPAGLLDSYRSEREPVAQRAILYSQAQVALNAPGSDVTALRRLFTELLEDRETVRRLADLAAGTDVRYDMGVANPHPLVGYFAPDLELTTADGSVRLAELARTARPLLIDLTGEAAIAETVAPGEGRFDLVTARIPESETTALLVRPDGYVAWASSNPHPDSAGLEPLRGALQRWFGSAECSEDVGGVPSG